MLENPDSDPRAPRRAGDDPLRANEGLEPRSRDLADFASAEDVQARLAAIVESSQDAIISKTLESRIVSWNAGAEQLFEYTAEEAIGRSITMLIPPERQDEEHEILARLRRGERVEHYETVRVSKTGRRIDVSLTISPLRDGSGRIVGASKIARDVTPRKRAEQRLSVQHSVTQALAEAADLHEAAPKVLQAICESLDWQLGALWRVGAPQDELRCVELHLAPGVQAPRFEQDARERAFARGLGLPGRVWARGGAVWVPDLARDEGSPRAPIAEAEGLHAAIGFPIVLEQRVLGVMEFLSREVREPDAAVLRVIKAIGSQMGQFVERRRAEAALRDSEQRARFLAAASAALADLTDQESTLQKLASLAVPEFADWCVVDLLVDGALRRLAMAHVDPARLEVVRELARRYPSPEDARRGVQQVVRTGEPEWAASITDELLVSMAQDDEHLRMVRGLGLKSYICVPLKSRGQTLGAISFVSAESGRSYTADDVRAAEDLANRAAIAIENARLLASLKADDRRKDEFLAMLSHELRNPLAPIRNAVQILRVKGSAAPEPRWATELIDRQLHHMTRLVDDLLDVSRITQGKVELRKEAVELAGILDSAVEASRPLMEKWGHRLTLALPAQSIRLEADPTRLAQMVSNLLNNAAKYTKHGGQIALRAEQEGKEAVVRVRDNGIGIRADVLPRVFELFTQGDPSAEQSEGGLGIGLTLVKRLAEMHGGSVEAHSEGPGKGSEFVLRMPLAREPARAERARDAEQAPPPAALRILVVDDNLDAADSLGMVLRMMGHEVATAHDGFEAVGAAVAFRPEVALLDIGLPRLNGFEVAQRIRAQEGGAGVILVALTGWGQKEDRDRSREAGFDHHMTKPVDFKLLQQLLGKITAARGTRRAGDPETA